MGFFFSLLEIGDHKEIFIFDPDSWQQLFLLHNLTLDDALLYLRQSISISLNKWRFYDDLRVVVGQQVREADALKQQKAPFSQQHKLDEEVSDMVQRSIRDA